MKTGKIAKKYCNQVSIRIPCPRKKKQYLLDGLYKEVSVFLNRNPEAELKDVVEHFGQPQSIAAAYVDDLGTDEILDALYVRRRLVTSVTAVLCAILIIWLVVASFAYLDAVYFSRGECGDHIIYTRVTTTEMGDYAQNCYKEQQVVSTQDEAVPAPKRRCIFSDGFKMQVPGLLLAGAHYLAPAFDI